MRSLVFGVLLLLIFLLPWKNMIAFSEFGTLARWVGYCVAFLALLCIVTLFTRSQRIPEYSCRNGNRGLHDIPAVPGSVGL